MTGQCTIVRIQSLFDERTKMKDPEKGSNHEKNPHTQKITNKGKQTNNNEE
jgi:hypothetical protein